MQIMFGWNRSEDGAVTVYAHDHDGRIAPVAVFRLQPLIDILGMTRAEAKSMQEKFADLIVENSK
jgi:hypothetical protein